MERFFAADGILTDMSPRKEGAYFEKVFPFRWISSRERSILRGRISRDQYRTSARRCLFVWRLRY